MTISKKLDRFATGAALVMAVGMMPQIATAEVTLKVADTFPPGHYIVETGTTYWMDRVTELTDGEVKFQYFGAGQLGSLRDMFSMVQTGVVDIGYVPPAYNGGTMPLAGVHTLPGLFSQSIVGTPAFFETVTSDPILENDFLANGMRPVWGATVARSHIYANTRTEPAMTPPRTSKANRGWESPTSSRPKGRVSSPPTDTLKFSLSRGASLQAGFLE